MTNNFFISNKKLIKVLIGITLILVFLSVVGNFLLYGLGYQPLAKLVRVFDLDSEYNIPTWFATILLLCSSVLLAIIARYKKFIKDIYARHWQGLAIIFLLLSIDEAAAIHETVGHYLRGYLNTGGFLFFAWVIPGIIFVFLLGLIYFKFLFSLPKRTFRLLVLSAIIFLAGVLGMEILGARYAYEHGMDNMTFVALSTIEEFLEKIGVIVFIYALLDYIRENKIIAQLRILK